MFAIIIKVQSHLFSFRDLSANYQEGLKRQGLIYFISNNDITRLNTISCGRPNILALTSQTYTYIDSADYVSPDSLHTYRL